ncbi:unnamed protein product [Rhodiola kirilowii]
MLPFEGGHSGCAVLVCPTWRCALTSIRLARSLLQLALVQATVVTKIAMFYRFQ